MHEGVAEAIKVGQVDRIAEPVDFRLRVGELWNFRGSGHGGNASVAGARSSAGVTRRWFAQMRRKHEHMKPRIASKLGGRTHSRRRFRFQVSANLHERHVRCVPLWKWHGGSHRRSGKS